MGILDFPQAALFASRAAARRKRKKAEEIKPEKQKTLLESLGGSGISALTTVANILDAPGSSVRSILAGKGPVDALQAFFDPSVRTYGREILYGKENRPGPADDIAGFAFDVATDPLTYLFPFGAYAKGARVAKSAGIFGKATKAASKAAGKTVGKGVAMQRTTLRETLKGATKEQRRAALQAAKKELPGAKAKRLSAIAGPKVVKKLPAKQPSKLAAPWVVEGTRPAKEFRLGDAFGVGLPFMKPAITFGGERAAKVQDVIGNFLRYNAVSRAVAQPFLKAGGRTKEGQILSQAFVEGTSGGSRAARMDTAKFLEAYAKGKLGAKDASGKLIVSFGEVRRMVEGLTTATPEVQAAARPFIASFEKILAENKALGLPLDEFVDEYIKYWPRRLDEAIKQTSIKGSRLRKFAGLGTEEINELVIAGAGIRKAAGKADGSPGTRQAVRDMLVAAEVPDETIIATGKKAGQTKKGRVDKLTDYIMDRQIGSIERGLFTNDPYLDAIARNTSGLEQLGGNTKIIEGLANKEFMDDVISAAGKEPELVPLRKALVEIFGDKATKYDPGVTINAIREMAGSPGRKGLKVMDGIPRSFLDEIKGFKSAYKPENLGTFVKTVDTFTALFKAGVLSPFPAFHVRNHVSGQFRNFISGMFSPWSYLAARRMMAGQNLTGKDVSRLASMSWVKRDLAGRTADAANVTDVLRARIFGEGVFDAAGGQSVGHLTGVGAERAPRDVGDLLSSIPGGFQGSQPKTLAGALGQIVEPGQGFAVQGALGAQETTVGFLKAGQSVGQKVEGLNRISPWLDQVAKGIDPQTAARKVLAAQIDYSAASLSSFERKFLLRAFPFYRFARGNLPWVVNQLIERPGGPLAQVIRGGEKLKSESGPLPQHVAGSLAVPLSGGPEGGQRILSSLGLMSEPAIESLGTLTRPSAAIMKVLGATSPLIKAPLEAAFGQSTFQRGERGGRLLENLDPVIGRTLSNILGRPEPLGKGQAVPRTLEFLLANSPLSRFASTARTISDPRKGALAKAANLLTGARVTDVSPAAIDKVLQSRLEAEMRSVGARSFENVYLPADIRAGMSPAERVRVERFLEIKRLLRSRAQARKQ